MARSRTIGALGALILALTSASVQAQSADSAAPSAPPAEATEPPPEPTTTEEERDKARQLANAGMDLIKGGETERGIAKLEEALALVPVPTIAVAVPWLTELHRLFFG